MKWPRTKDALGFDDTRLMLIGIPVVAFMLCTILFAGQIEKEGAAAIYLYCLPISVVYTTLFWIAFRAIICHGMLKYPSREDTKRRLIYQSILIIVAWLILDALASKSIDKLVHQLTAITDPPNIVKNIATLLVTAMIIAIYEAMRFQELLRRAEVDKTRLAQEHTQSQLQGLKDQVNPHFLFNSLNTLAQLIPEDAQRAESFVQQLSKVYRYILDIRNEPLIRLREELNFLDAYFHLHKERFGDNLRIHQTIPTPYHDYMIVPLSLQLLIENAIKHNEISNAHQLDIQLFVDNNEQLVVQNNLKPKAFETSKSTKLGLQNIQNRYRLSLNQSILIQKTEEYFTVKIPLIKVKTFSTP